MDELFDQARLHDNAAQVQLISRLRREEPEAVKVILRHFKDGDKFAAELLVRTFYPYAENLLVALESRSPNNRMTSQSIVAPSLTVPGSRRAELLNDFFIRFIKDAPELELSSGIKLYIFRSFMDSFSRRMRSFSSRDGLEAVKSGVKGSAQSAAAGETDDAAADSVEAMFRYDSFSGVYDSQRGRSGKTSSSHNSETGLNARDKKRISGLPVSRPAADANAPRNNEPAASGRNRAEEPRVAKEPKFTVPARSVSAASAGYGGAKAAGHEASRSSGGKKAETAYARWQAYNSRTSLTLAAERKRREAAETLKSDEIKNKKNVSAAESKNAGPSAPQPLRQTKTSALAGSISQDGAGKAMRPSEDMKIHAALQGKAGKVSLAPSIPDSQCGEPAAQGYSVASEDELRAALSGKAKYVLSALNSLVASDIEAYRYVVMRYFACRTFAQLSQDFDVKSSADIGMRLLRGLKAIIKNTPLT